LHCFLSWGPRRWRCYHRFSNRIHGRGVRGIVSLLCSAWQTGCSFIGEVWRRGGFDGVAGNA
jgi:hypothetical protein